MKYPPSITIAGVALQCEFTSTGNAVVLDDVRINWGRESLYSPTNPSDITLTLLDPTGVYASSPNLFGQELILSTPLGVLFKGRVDGITMTPVEIGDDPETQTREMWQVEITATDVIAALGRLIIPGPGPLGTYIAADYIQQYGQNMWPYDNTQNRLQAVENAIKALGVPLDIEARDFAQAAPAGKTWSVWYKETDISMGDDAYTHVQRVQARGDEFFTANYLPYKDTLSINRWALPASLELAYANSIISVVASAASGAHIIDCGTVYMADDGAVTASVEHNIAALEIAEYMRKIITITQAGGTTGQVVTWQATSQISGVATPGGGSARYQSPAMLALSTTTAGDPSSSQSEKASDFAARLAPLAAELNGKILPPEFVFDIEEFDYDAETVTDLMATWTRPNVQPPAWAFPGSRFEQLTGFGPFFQIIGGELRFQQGWTHTARFAPSRGAAGTLAINQLVTTDPPLFSQYDLTISLATLGIVTKGI
jgi:hypothetical protein